MSSKREKGIRLLKEGFSYNQISSRLIVAKGTINSWFVRLPETDKEKVRKFRIQNWKESNKEKSRKRVKATLAKEEEIQVKAARKVNALSQKDLFLVGISLYWAEGGKKNRYGLQFSNSDPKMIELIMHFFRKICRVNEQKFYMQMILHKNIKEEKALKYWSEITKVPVKQFKKACYSVSKSSKGKRNKYKLPFGTLQVRIHDKQLTHQIYGYIRGLKREGSSVVERLVANEKVAGPTPVPRSRTSMK